MDEQTLYKAKTIHRITILISKIIHRYHYTKQFSLVRFNNKTVFITINSNIDFVHYHKGLKKKIFFLACLKTSIVVIKYKHSGRYAEYIHIVAHSEIFFLSFTKSQCT